MNRRDAAVAELERRIGHPFRDRELLERALTHASVGKGATKVLDNERLEFLGDRVLNLMAAERLMELRPLAREGEMSRLMNQLVNFNACARAAKAAGLRDAMRIDASASRVGARDNDRVLGDACEALIAALYIEGGLDAARRFFLTFWTEAFETLDSPQVKDSKTLLQEWAMARGLAVPTYEVVASIGPSHAPRFTVRVSVTGVEPETAEGGSKREAEKAAAEMMLLKQEGRP